MKECRIRERTRDEILKTIYLRYGGSMGKNEAKNILDH